MTLTAIPTRYALITFRSRLEARWAVFFETLGIPWTYEPEGFRLVNGSGYVPDFYLPDQRLWVEVKPVGGDTTKMHWFAQDLDDGERAAVFRDIPRLDDGFVEYADHTCAIEMIGPYGDWDYAWCVCSGGKHADIQFQGRGHRIECPCPGQRASDRGHSWNHPAILAAYTAARNERFGT